MIVVGCPYIAVLSHLQCADVLAGRHLSDTVSARHRMPCHAQLVGVTLLSLGIHIWLDEVSIPHFHKVTSPELVSLWCTDAKWSRVAPQMLYDAAKADA